MIKKVTGDKGLAKFQQANCTDCHFADKKKVGTGEPCCTFARRLEVKGEKCLSMRY